jgi:hypothetical protein
MSVLGDAGLSLTSAIAREDHPQLQHVERGQDRGRAEARRPTFNAFGLGLPSLGPDVAVMVQSLMKEQCRTKAIESDSEEGWDVARELLKWFQIV